MKKILFISHDATRTGAPYVLLQFLQWLKNYHNDSICFDVLFIKGGNIQNEFEQLAVKTYHLSDFNVINKESFFNKIKRFALKRIIIKSKETKKYDKLLSNNYEIIYANTMISIPLAVELKKATNSKLKVIAHIHELNTIIDSMMPNFRDYVPLIDNFISVSRLVKENLEQNYGVLSKSNPIIYEFSDKKIIRTEGLNKNKIFEVGASGYVHWRKGDDIFIQVANYIKNYHPELEIQFTWVGGMNNNQKTIVENDLKKMNLTECVRFVGEQHNPESYYSNFDLFLLPSREDPFPLVSIEMGKFGVPILCFEKATGTAEIITNGGGYILPYLDCKAMAEKIVFYYYNREELIKDGEFNKKQFARFSSENQCKEIFDYIQNLKLLQE
jgi:glycosyltransferase involved in cell wall biosynthesis|nr:glycosyltransferase [uncultured Flavobacterium sp.]